MSVISGILGTVNGINTVRNWSINTSSDVQPFAATNTHGGTVRMAGNQDWSGQFTAYGHTPPVMPGQTFSFAGSINGAIGASGPAIVDRVELGLDIEGGRVVEWSCAFSSDGELTFGAASSSDGTLPDVPTSLGCKIQLGTLTDPAVFTDLPELRGFHLVIQSRNHPYRSSSTAGQTRRVAGNIDWTLNIVTYCSDFSELIPRNTVKGIRLFVTPTEYWELLWGIFAQVSGLQVNRELPNTVAAQYAIAMTGVTRIDDTPTLGCIKKPAGTNFWPATSS